MASPSFLAARKNVTRSLLTGFGKSYQTKKLDKKVRISSVITKKIIRWVLRADTASSQQVVVVLKTDMRSRKAVQSPSMIAIADLLRLCHVRLEQIGQVSKARTALQACAAGDGRVSKRFFTLLGQTAVSLT